MRYELSNWRKIQDEAHAGAHGIDCDALARRHARVWRGEIDHGDRAGATASERGLSSPREF
jgi:hypothetical protein